MSNNADEKIANCAPEESRLTKFAYATLASMTNRLSIKVGRRDIVLQDADIQAVLAKVVIGHTGDCWVWPGPMRPDGYGRQNLYRDGRNREIHAHRLVYTLLVERIPEGLVIDHLCRNRSCVNPHHLEVVTPAENTRRGSTKTHCKRGHEFDEVNTRVGTKGQRSCRVCYTEVGRERNRAYYRANKEAYKLRMEDYWRRRLGVDTRPDCEVVTQYGTVCGRPEGHEGRHFPRRK